MVYVFTQDRNTTAKNIKESEKLINKDKAHINKI